MAKSQQKSLFETGWYNNLRYNVIPPLFVLVFTAAVQWLGLLGERPCPLDLDQCPRLLGSSDAWILTGSYLLWVFVWLWIPDKKYKGPISPEGEIPEYQDNGFQFYLATCLLYCALQFMNPLLSRVVVDNYPEILACLSIVALILCLWLCISGRLLKGKVQEGASFFYDFYRGCELHPKILGCDAKQLTVSRLGMSLWQVLILAAFFVGPKRAPEVVSLVVQSIYIAKFFWWENGYYTTLDITYDRAGYYLCWGGSVWIPALFPLSQMYMTRHLSTLSSFGSALILVLGIFATAVEYQIDREKEEFVAWRQNYVKRKAKPYKLWGEQVRFLEVLYKDAKGQQAKSALLTSGYWGKARHLNYTCELIICFTCCATAAFGNNWFLPLFYFYFIAALIPHRILRDEEKCSKKYGEYWDQYCELVPYRLIPGFI